MIVKYIIEIHEGLYLVNMYAGINIRLFFYCVVYCIAVLFVAARVALYYLLKDNFDFLFNSKWKYDNFLRITYRQHQHI
jgi:hypothetical protein